MQFTYIHTSLIHPTILKPIGDETFLSALFFIDSWVQSFPFAIFVLKISSLISDTVAPNPVQNLRASFASTGLAISWIPPSNYKSVFVSGYHLVIRDITDATNLFDVIKLKGWNSLSFTVTNGVGMWLSNYLSMIRFICCMIIASFLFSAMFTADALESHHVEVFSVIEHFLSPFSYYYVHHW